MSPGSWQVRITADGAKGEGATSVPIAAVASTTKTMQLGMGILLGACGVFLVAGLVAIAGASLREAKLTPGVRPSATGQRRGRIAMAIAFFVVAGVLWAGNEWWNSEARSYRETVYRPTQMNASVGPNGLLTLQLLDSGWLEPPSGAPRRVILFYRRHSLDDLVAEHDHLMHLYAIRQPGLDALYHLHPDELQTGTFHLQLPEMLPGTYHLYADIVHANGFPETPVAIITIPRGLPARPLAGDDSSAITNDWMQSSTGATSFTLPDHYRMEWLRSKEPLRAREGTSFRFRLVDQQGHAPAGMALYMGMLGHAAFVKTDGSVFAHIHPMGTASMAAMNLAQNQADAPPHSSHMSAMDMSQMDMTDMSGMKMPGSRAALPNQVSFPYGFPAPGRYRIFVQMKHDTTVETGVFDTTVE
jgi:hypothetical protein